MINLMERLGLSLTSFLQPTLVTARLSAGAGFLFPSQYRSINLRMGPRVPPTPHEPNRSFIPYHSQSVSRAKTPVAHLGPYSYLA